MIEPIYVCGAARSAIGRFGGTLAPLGPADLSVPVAVAALARAGATPDLIEETVWGHGRQAGGGPNTARQVSVRAGVPVTSPAFTVNKACGSSLFALVHAARMIRAGEAQVLLAGGVESMSNTPYLLTNARWGMRMGHQEVVDGMTRDGFFCPLAEQLMGLTAETLAEQYGITRAAQDAYAATSQERAVAAWAAGAFDAELVPIEVPGRNPVTLRTDEHVRADSTAAAMSKLKPIFKEGGTVHAGNSSGVTDGAAAMVVASASAVERHGLRPLARVVAWQSAGVDPRVMGIGPVPATRQLLERLGLTMGDLDLIELNEAFAAQVLACNADLKFPLDRLNVHGGAIALGHPIGATGARIVATLLHAMERRDARRGLATLCISGGMGLSVLFERGGLA